MTQRPRLNEPPERHRIDPKTRRVARQNWPSSRGKWLPVSSNFCVEIGPALPLGCAHAALPAPTFFGNSSPVAQAPSIRLEAQRNRYAPVARPQPQRRPCCSKKRVDEHDQHEQLGRCQTSAVMATVVVSDGRCPAPCPPTRRSLDFPRQIGKVLAPQPRLDEIGDLHAHAERSTGQQLCPLQIRVRGVDK